MRGRRGGGMATLVSGIKMSMPKLIGSPGDRRRDMRRSGLCLYFHYAVSALVLIGLSRTATSGEPLALHPKNPHYFLFRGKPAILVTSGQHYGAVLNLDFDYRKYLATLAGDGLNLTRTFTGAYVEPVGAFKIERNTLAPSAGRFICPWARSDAPGYVNGGARFDLTRWDMVWYHHFTLAEITSATGMDADEVKAALERFGIRAENK